MMVIMAVDTLISVEEYLRTSFHPDRHFIDGQVVERNVGQTRHSYAQTETAVWFAQRRETLRLQPLTELRVRVAPPRICVPDVVISEIPIPGEDVFTSPPYLYIEIMSPDDTKGSTQPSLNDYLNFRVPNIWVIDPWKHRGWVVTASGWAKADDGIMRTADARVAMPLSEVLLP
jgi:Uma2 family endonuclease